MNYQQFSTSIDPEIYRFVLFELSAESIGSALCVVAKYICTAEWLSEWRQIESKCVARLVRTHRTILSTRSSMVTRNLVIVYTESKPLMY